MALSSAELNQQGRRRFLRATTILASTTPLLACVRGSEKVPPMLAGSDEELKWRFRGIRGGERLIGSLASHFPIAVPIGIFGVEGEKSYMIELPQSKSKHGSISSYGGGDFSVPKLIRMVIHQPGGRLDSRGERERSHRWFDSAISFDTTVECASRFPLEVLDAVRAGEGGLRFKIRAAPWGPLIGWDIAYMEKFGPGVTTISAFPKYKMAGGDFREAEVFNGKVVRAGWYIDPKTGQRVETDY